MNFTLKLCTSVNAATQTPVHFSYLQPGDVCSTGHRWIDSVIFRYYFVPRCCYNNYFYPINLINVLQDGSLISHLDKDATLPSRGGCSDVNVTFLNYIFHVLLLVSQLYFYFFVFLIFNFAIS